MGFRFCQSGSLSHGVVRAVQGIEAVRQDSRQVYIFADDGLRHNVFAVQKAADEVPRRRSAHGRIVPRQGFGGSAPPSRQERRRTSPRFPEENHSQVSALGPAGNLARDTRIQRSRDDQGSRRPRKIRERHPSREKTSQDAGGREGRARQARKGR